ncbi:MAG: hypothetical protein KDA71_14065, partial [Planctomycetales bacterium]|nr:hypothetical protein [Planctomycetales bacterium]
MNSKLQPLTLHIHGMDCAEEVAVLKRELGPLVGSEEQLVFDILNGKLTVLSDAAGVSADDLIRAIARTGMRAELWHEGNDRKTEAGFWQRHGRTLTTTLSGVSGLIGLVTHISLAGSFSEAFG